MAAPHIPELYKSPHMISELISDLRAHQSGTKFYFVVDPADIIDFCFPLNPADQRAPDMRAIAEDQAALYEILMARETQPLLLPEYAAEMSHYTNFLRGAINTLHENATMLRQMAQEIVIEKEDLRTTQKLVAAIRENFHLILALVMGEFSFGAERFRYVSNRLVPFRTLGRPYDEFAASYRESDLKRRLIDAVIGALSKQEGEGIITSYEAGRRRRSALIDASAVDRLLHINRSLQRLHEADPASQRQVVLYLSSAVRTRAIFARLRELMPNWDKISYPFWRTRAQVFAWIVHRAINEDGTENLSRTLENLEEFKIAAEKIKHLSERLAGAETGVCAGCPRLGVASSVFDTCTKREFCLSVSELDRTIENRQNGITNLGLAAGVRRYRMLERVLRPPRNEQNYAGYIEVFRAVFKNARVRDLALEKFQTLQAFSGIQAESTTVLADGLARHELANPQDNITAMLNRLPVHLRVSLAGYEDIQERLLMYYRTPISELRSKAGLLTEAYSLFVAKDAAMNELVDAHELVRTMLYLAFPFPEAVNKALSHGRDALERFPALESEFAYLVIWAARMSREYQYADELAQRSSAKFRNDARPHHGRALNIVAWKTEFSQSCPYGYIDAIQECKTAVHLYDSEGDIGGEMVGACLNDLAYLYALDPEDKESFDLNEARVALDRLKQRVDKQKWDPAFPEFFHTEAYVEYQEVAQAISCNSVNATVRAKIDFAKRDIEAAIRLLPKPRYMELRDILSRVEQRISKSRR